MAKKRPGKKKIERFEELHEIPYARGLIDSLYKTVTAEDFDRIKSLVSHALHANEQPAWNRNDPLR